MLPGHYTRTDRPASLHEIAWTLQVEVRPGVVISHETAAELYGLPLPRALTWRFGAPVHGSLEVGYPSSGRLLIVHRATRLGKQRHRALIMVPPLVAIQQIAGSLDHAGLVACVDALLGQKADVALPDKDSATREADGLRGRGSCAVRRAVHDSREMVWSPMETRARLLLLRAGYPEPSTNLKVVDPSTGRHFYLDLAYEQFRIAIEYDGDFHRTNRRAWQKDLHKHEVLHQLGWVVLRITIADLRDPRDFFRRLSDAMRRAGTGRP